MRFILVAMLVVLGYAKDELHYFSIDSLMEEANEVLDKDITFIWGSGSNETIIKEVQSSQKTNAFLKDKEKSCRWAMLGALKKMQKLARLNGGSKIVNITGYYKKHSHRRIFNVQWGISWWV